MTPVVVEVVGALTTFVNPAASAADTGTSTVVDGLDAGVRVRGSGRHGDGRNEGTNGCTNACHDDELQGQLSHERTSF